MRKMIKKTAFIAMTIMVILIHLVLVYADDNIKRAGDFSYYIENGEVVIERYHGSGGNVVIPNTIEGKPVTIIGQSAFEDCSSITGIKIPDSVTQIKKWSFSGCNKLKKIDIPSSVSNIESYVFIRCNSLSAITVNSNNSEYSDQGSNGIFSRDGKELYVGCKKTTIPEGVTNIETYAFRECDGLSSVRIPSSVTSIGFPAFWKCDDLVSITVDENNNEYSDQGSNGIFSKDGKKLYKGCKNTTLPSGLESIEKEAFRYCAGLTSISIPLGVTDLNVFSFQGCNDLTTMTVHSQNSEYSDQGCNGIFTKDGKKLCIGCKNTTIPLSKTTTIGYGAFRECESLVSIDIPSNITTIEECAFMDCSGLTSIVIPASVTEMDGTDFWGCDSLASMTIDENNSYYSDQNSNGIFSKDGKILYCGCKNTTIPSSVTSIEQGAFQNCIGLTSIDIPSSVTDIGENVFFGCQSLVRVKNDSSVYLPLPGGGWKNEEGNEITDIANGIAVRELPGPVDPEDKYVVINGIKYTFSGNNATVVGMETCIDGKISIPLTVNDTNGKTYTVIAIGEDAFKDCSELKEVSILYSVKEIGESAFDGCIHLDSVKLSSQGIINIGDDAFSGCGSLKYINLPNSLKKIGDNAFENSGIEKIGISNALPNTLEEIGGYAFFNTRLTSITIPKGVKKVGEAAFENCGNLGHVRLREGVVEIEESAFSCCSGNFIIYIPASVKKIGNDALSSYDEENDRYTVKYAGTENDWKSIEGISECGLGNNDRIIYSVNDDPKSDNPEEKNGNKDNTEPVIETHDNKPMNYSAEPKGEYQVAYNHDIPFWGKSKVGIESFGEITVSSGNATYIASKIKVNKKKKLIQVTGLNGADKETVKAVKRATKGANGLPFKINPYYVKNSDTVSIKRKKDNSIKQIKVKINGRDYKAKTSEWEYDNTQDRIIFKGDNLNGSYSVS